MAPPESPTRSGSRYSTLSTSRVLVAIPILAGVLLLFVSVYAYLIGPEGSHNPSGPQVLGLVVTLILGFTIGAWLGGWAWCFLAKTFLGLTRDEAEPFLRPMLSNGPFTRYTNRYLDTLFGPRPPLGDSRRIPSGRLGSDASVDREASAGAALHECRASRITAPWDERTIHEFNLATLKTDWWQATQGTLRIMPEVLAFDDWSLPYSEIDDAVVTLIRGIVPSYVIRIKSGHQSYQFSVAGSYFGGDFPFPARRTTVKGFTWSDLLVRVLPVLALLGYLLWSSRK
jgi:hypothetical protein